MQHPSMLTLLMLALAVLARGQQDDDYASENEYDPTARDFTERCMEMAELAGSKACILFMRCCSEDMMLQKFNGDRCQIKHPSNGCTMNPENTMVQWSQCKAMNCTPEVTTTTTTTTAVPVVGAAPSLCASGVVLGVVAVLHRL